MQTKICSVCKNDLPIDRFAKNGTKKDDSIKYSCRCKNCQKVLSKKHYHNNKKTYQLHCQQKRARNREYVDNYKKQHSCKKCSEKRHECLDLHHTGNDKDDTVFHLIYRGVAIKRLQKELNKCITLCANCHAQLHYKRVAYNQPRIAARWLRKYKDTIQCSKCNHRGIASLDFHHTNSATKIDAVGNMAGWTSVAKLIEEIEKCIVLCKNCHRLHHIRYAELV